MNIDLSVTLVTPEDAPLEVFGSAVSEAVAKVLSENGIQAIHSAYAETPRAGEVTLHPGSSRLEVDRAGGLPQLSGPATPGLPKNEADGFIPIDPYCRVRGVDAVWGGGCESFAIKHGGIAAQQADTAAQSIAALAGAPVKPANSIR